jgi:hypothetical protein
MTERNEPKVRFTPWKLISAMFAIAFAVGCVAVVRLLIPDEAAPDVVTRENGDRHFVLMSLEDDLTMPVALLGIAAGLTIAVKYFPRDRVYEERAAAYAKNPPKTPLIAKIIAWPLGIALVGILMLLLWLCVIWFPLTRFRGLTVSPKQVTMESAFRSWSVPREQIHRVEVQRRLDERKGRETLGLLIGCDGDRIFSSVEFNPCASCPEQRELVAFLEQLRDELRPVVTTGSVPPVRRGG